MHAETYTESRTMRHVDLATPRCDECGAVKIAGGSGCGTGYASVPHPGAPKERRMVCYACADQMQRTELADRSGPFLGYISSDGATFTTWTGGTLGRVTSHSSYRGGWHGSRLHCYRVRDVHGADWFGRSAGPGMCIRLRPCKGVA